jgi:hypothetical protein
METYRKIMSSDIPIKISFNICCLLEGLRDGVIIESEDYSYDNYSIAIKKKIVEILKKYSLKVVYLSEDYIDNWETEYLADKFSRLFVKLRDIDLVKLRENETKYIGETLGLECAVDDFDEIYNKGKRPYKILHLIIESSERFGSFKFQMHNCDMPYEAVLNQKKLNKFAKEIDSKYTVKIEIQC